MATTFASGSYVFGNTVRLVFDGGTYNTSSTASSSSKPETAHTGWLTIPSCESVEYQHKKETREAFSPTTGHRVRTAVHHVQSSRTVKCVFNNLDMRLLQMAFGRNGADGTDEAFQPTEGVDKMAWVEIKSYTADNVLQFTYTAWCRVSVQDSQLLDDNIVKTTLVFEEVYNSLNEFKTI